MSLPQFNDILSFSNSQISEEIIKTENEVFNLRFKKATRQTFKPHQIKFSKRRLAQLKTLLNRQLQQQESKKQDVIT